MYDQPVRPGVRHAFHQTPEASRSALAVDRDVQTVQDLALPLRKLRHRHARQHGGNLLTYRQLAAKTGWSHGIIGEYFAGNVLPPPSGSTS
ncbi:hypothetical protein [Catellatospora sichuanensis]|uniref:hypothetical protein n=1 Tax=Catellatospora sichuanensis TaxID=1969805 RepID=UPI0016426EBA|nr:hypothetical protein [Catellatospora sichuanensis]